MRAIGKRVSICQKRLKPFDFWLKGGDLAHNFVSLQFNF